MKRKITVTIEAKDVSDEDVRCVIDAIVESLPPDVCNGGYEYVVEEKKP